MIFVIPEFHNGTKEIPLDFDIPQSLKSLQFVGYKIGPGTEIKATNPSIDIMNCWMRKIVIASHGWLLLVIIVFC